MGLVTVAPGWVRFIPIQLVNHEEITGSKGSGFLSFHFKSNGAALVAPPVSKYVLDPPTLKDHLKRIHDRCHSAERQPTFNRVPG